jgi:predicted branched-subunit amino acid permease
VSIDTTFHPITPTILVGVTAVQAAVDTQQDNTTFRVRCLVAAYLTWGNKSTITALGAPAAGVPSANTLGMSVVGSAMYIEVPANSFFISSIAASFEITGGKGGVGG